MTYEWYASYDIYQFFYFYLFCFSKLIFFFFVFLLPEEEGLDRPITLDLYIPFMFYFWYQIQFYTPFILNTCI